jgi:hypothetical protein
VEVSAPDLAKLAIEAHGGLERWKRFTQTLYFDQQGLLKRHDYDVEISGGTGAAHYGSDLKEFSGIVFPTKRRIFPRQPDGHSAPEPLVVSIDLDQSVLF